MKYRYTVYVQHYGYYDVEVEDMDIDKLERELLEAKLSDANDFLKRMISHPALSQEDKTTLKKLANTKHKAQIASAYQQIIDSFVLDTSGVAMDANLVQLFNSLKTLDLKDTTIYDLAQAMLFKTVVNFGKSLAAQIKAEANASAKAKANANAAIAQLKQEQNTEAANLRKQLAELQVNLTKIQQSQTEKSQLLSANQDALEKLREEMKTKQTQIDDLTNLQQQHQTRQLSVENTLNKANNSIADLTQELDNANKKQNAAELELKKVKSYEKQIELQKALNILRQTYSFKNTVDIVNNWEISMKAVNTIMVEHINNFLNEVFILLNKYNTQTQVIPIPQITTTKTKTEQLSNVPQYLRNPVTNLFYAFSITTGIVWREQEHITCSIPFNRKTNTAPTITARTSQQKYGYKTDITSQQKYGYKTACYVYENINKIITSIERKINSAQAQ